MTLQLTRFMLSAILLASCAALTHAQSPAASAQKYPVKFNAPDKVGQQFRMTVKQTENINNKVSTMGTVMQQEQKATSAELVALGTVIAVSPKGITQKQSLLIEKCVKMSEGMTQTLLPKGTTVIAAIENGAVNFYVKGRRVPEAVREMLDDLAGMDKNGERDEEMFEPAAPKAVGESWPINVQRAVAGMRRMKVTVAPQNVRGNVKLEGVSTVGQEKYLAVGASMQVSAFSVPLPPGAKLVSSDIKGYFKSKLPVNIALLPPDHLMRLSAAFVMTMKPDAASPEIMVNTVAETTITVHLEDLSNTAPKTVASVVK